MNHFLHISRASRGFSHAVIVSLFFTAAILGGVTDAAITATGDVSPSPPMAGNSIQIGSQGIGSLLIDSGSTFDSNSMTLGASQSGFGKATVTGAGSFWTIDNGVVGSSGLGRLEIRQGAIVQVENGSPFFLGQNYQGHGTVVVDDEGSLLQSDAQMWIGNSGIGLLQIGTGATVNVPNHNVLVGNGRIELQGGFLRGQYIENGGVITGSGEIVVQSNGNLQNSGRIEADAGDRLRITAPNSSELQNRGEITAHGGEIEFGPGLTNETYGATPGKITLQNGVFRAGVPGSNDNQPQLTNRGLIAAIEGENHLHGSVRNESNGDIAVTNNSLLMFHNSVQTQNNSTISVFAGSTAIFLDDLIMNGGTLLADLAGVSGYGHVEVVGDVQLSGNLAINLSSGYTPQAGDSFQLMTVAGGIGGWLNLIPTTDLPDELEWNLDIGANSVLLSVVAPLAGDYNGDDTVDAADYTLWRDTLGSDSELAADGSGNNVVDQDDYDVWKANFGATTAGGAAASHAVPEPTSVMILAFGMTSLLASRRRSA